MFPEAPPPTFFSLLLGVTTLIALVENCWDYLEDAVQLRVTNYVKDMPKDNLVPGLLRALEVPPLYSIAVQQISRLDTEELISLISADPRREFVNCALTMYAESGTFDQANSLARRLILPLTQSLELDDVDRICKAAEENGQVRESNQLPTVLTGIASAGKVPRAKIAEMISKYQLTRNPRLLDLLVEFDPDD
jgi:hypothetical protein